MEGPISHSPQLIDFIQWAFYTLISFFGWQIVTTLKDLSEKVAVIIARVDTHEKRLDEHDEELKEVTRRRK